jgi:hypothetical protein
MLLSFPKIRGSGRIGIFHPIRCRNCETLGEVRRKRLDPRGVIASAEAMPDQDVRVNGSGDHDHEYTQDNYFPALHLSSISLARIGARDGAVQEQLS